MKCEWWQSAGSSHSNLRCGCLDAILHWSGISLWDFLRIVMAVMAGMAGISRRNRNGILEQKQYKNDYQPNNNNDKKML